MACEALRLRVSSKCPEHSEDLVESRRGRSNEVRDATGTAADTPLTYRRRCCHLEGGL